MVCVTTLLNYQMPTAESPAHHSSTRIQLAMIVYFPFLFVVKENFIFNPLELRITDIGLWQLAVCFTMDFLYIALAVSWASNFSMLNYGIDKLLKVVLIYGSKLLRNKSNYRINKWKVLKVLPIMLCISKCSAPWQKRY